MPHLAPEKVGGALSVSHVSSRGAALAARCCYRVLCWFGGTVRFFHGYMEGVACCIVDFDVFRQCKVVPIVFCLVLQTNTYHTPAGST